MSFWIPFMGILCQTLCWSIRIWVLPILSNLQIIFYVYSKGSMPQTEVIICLYSCRFCLHLCTSCTRPSLDTWLYMSYLCFSGWYYALYYGYVTSAGINIGGFVGAYCPVQHGENSCPTTFITDMQNRLWGPVDETLRSACILNYDFFHLLLLLILYLYFNLLFMLWCLSLFIIVICALSVKILNY